MKTLDARIQELGLTIRSERTTDNPFMADQGDRMRHWKCQLRLGRRRLTVVFSQGSAWTTEPTAADVLDCLASDAASYDNAASFEDWAADYGYDTDSRKAERIYRTVGVQAAKLRAFLGDAYDAVLFETERQ